ARHIVDRNLELLRPFDIRAPRVNFAVPRPPVEEARADAIVAATDMTASFAVVNPGAGWPSKLWPPERFAAVVRYLGHDRGLSSLIVWAGPQEKSMAERIVVASEGYARLAPATSLTELAALVRRARLFVGSDTGPLHLAAAVGTPCVALFGPMPAER